MTRKELVQELSRLAIAIPVLVFFLFPLFYLMTIGFKFPIEFMGKPPSILPRNPTLDHYNTLITNFNLFVILTNSATASFGSMVMAMLLGVPAAYGLARMPFRGRATLATWVLSTRFLPPIAVVIPIFLIFRDLNLLNNLAGLVILYTAFNLPFVIWIMLNFFRELPRDLEDAARVDGATQLGVFWRIVLPLARPGLASTAIFCIIFTWNEFLFALILNSTPASQTLSVGMALFVSERGVLWGPMGALATVSVLPIIVFTLLLRKSFVRGLTFGAIQG